MASSAGKIEELIRLVWCRQLYTGVGGPAFGVIGHGRANPGEGMELLDVRFELDGTVYRGPAAIHEYASDWYKHAHHEDPGYDHCVLNLVVHDDAVICRADGSVIPNATIVFPRELAERYERLLGESGSYRCGALLAGMPEVKRYNLLTELTCERLERKYDEFLQRYRQADNNWNEAFYVSLFRAVGAGSNRESYERLARTVSFTQICRVRESVASAEALLLGAAGLLEAEPSDDYSDKLRYEFKHLSRRFGIVPMHRNAWNLRSGRPDQKPVLRIAELAALLVSGEFFFSRLVNCKTQRDIRQVFSASASEYWTTHYCFGQPSGRSVKRFGDMMLDNLGINLVVPMIFAYGKITGNEELKERAIGILEEIRAENHIRIVREWKTHGVAADNAFFSQGLLELTREYCEKKRCAYCNIGRIVLCSQ